MPVSSCRHSFGEWLAIIFRYDTDLETSYYVVVYVTTVLKIKSFIILTLISFQ